MAKKFDKELYRLQAELCKTFADPNRLIIINELRSGEKGVGDLQKVLGVPQPLVSRHLALLRERDVVKSRREGANIYYRLADPEIAKACDIVHRVLLNQITKRKETAERLIPSPK